MSDLFDILKELELEKEQAKREADQKADQSEEKRESPSGTASAPDTATESAAGSMGTMNDEPWMPERQSATGAGAASSTNIPQGPAPVPPYAAYQNQRPVQQYGQPPAQQYGQPPSQQYGQPPAQQYGQPYPTAPQNQYNPYAQQRPQAPTPPPYYHDAQTPYSPYQPSPQNQSAYEPGLRDTRNNIQVQNSVPSAGREIWTADSVSPYTGYSQNTGNAYEELKRKAELKKQHHSGGKKGLKITLITLAIILAVFVVSLAVYAVVNIAGNTWQLSSSMQSSQANESSSSGNKGIVTPPDVSIENTPAGEESSVEGGALSAQSVFKKVSPSVVSITAYGEDYFTGGSYGSGIIFSSEGYILTNAHVLQNSKYTFSVKLANGKEYEAKFIAADSKTDLGIIKIEAQGLTPASLGDSTKLVVGDSVYAIGNPAGPEFQSSLSVGYVSGLNRNVAEDENITYIQTDAAINPGNSGGALINQYGQVIGINTSKIGGEDYEGLGFAIPISQAKPIVDELLKNGRISNRVKIGAEFRVISSYTAEVYGIPEGLCVVTMIPESDLVKKGVQVGDIITAIEGKPILNVTELKEMLKGKKVGDTLKMNVVRKKRNSQTQEKFTVSIVLIEDIDQNFS